MIEKQPFLMAFSNNSPSLILNTPDNIAAYIATNNTNNVRICTPDETTLISSCGPFLDKCVDVKYLNQNILPKLCAYQRNPETIPQIKYLGSSRNKGLSR